MNLDLRSHRVRTLRALVTRAGSFSDAWDFLVGRLIVAAVGTFLFALLANNVMAGSTQAFDEAALRWIKTYHSRP